MNKWLRVTVLVLLVLVSAMLLKQAAVETAGGTGPVPPTPWLTETNAVQIAGGTGPVPPTPWITGTTSGPVPAPVAR